MTTGRFMRNLSAAMLAAFVISIGTILVLEAAEPNLQMPTQAGGQAFQALRPDPLQSQAFGLGTTSVESSVIGAEVVRVICDVACLVEISGPASLSSPLLPANVAVYFRTLSGTDKIAARAVSTGGTIYITPMK